MLESAESRLEARYADISALLSCAYEQVANVIHQRKKFWSSCERSGASDVEWVVDNFGTLSISDAHDAQRAHSKAVVDIDLTRYRAGRNYSDSSSESDFDVRIERIRQASRQNHASAKGGKGRSKTAKPAPVASSDTTSTTSRAPDTRPSTATNSTASHSNKLQPSTSPPDYNQMSLDGLKKIAKGYGLRTNTSKKMLVHNLTKIWTGLHSKPQ
ncbi:hypothetical protein EV182_001311 [Spiromyces aspiralis]|uniref:Uncharacterized protein n=1 Tax=Spiromyces aspiralis TaxID=68401 RepID=A0ACC1HJB4_9FUNG|nr:hypothetical protein EV182_001311 [Spiromyces aspiralis]